MALLESGEMYLETLYILRQRSDSVRAVDICEYMSYSKPSVSRGLSILKKNGYVTADKGGFLSLTPTGFEIASKIYEKHKVISAILMALGVDEQTATKDACRIEHVISDKSFAAIKEHYLKHYKG